MMWSWHWLTPLGHIAVVWPLTLGTAAMLAARRTEPGTVRAAATWLAAMAAASLLVAASKIAFYGWGIGIREWNLTCFSGHTVLALAFWPVFLALLVPPQWSRMRGIAVVAGVIVGLMVGISRLRLGAHPPSEVLAGVALGAISAALSLRGLRDHCLGVAQLGAAGVLVAVLCVWSGIRPSKLPTERWLAEWGAQLSERQKPFRRNEWIRSEVQRDGAASRRRQK